MNKYKERKKEYYSRPEIKERQRALYLIRAYKLDLKTYNEMLISQNNKCAICKSDFSKVTCCVDHNHITKSIRGLLCSKCNIVLGYFNDKISFLKNAIDYLKKARK
jgi:hypothetical protein